MIRYILCAYDDHDDEDVQLVTYVTSPDEEYLPHRETDVTDILSMPTPITSELVTRLDEEE